MEDNIDYKEITNTIKNNAIKLPHIVLSDRQLCDLELILNGGFYPLNSFLSKIDYECVLDNMRLENGKLWPIPITLDIRKEYIDSNITN